MGKHFKCLTLKGLLHVQADGKTVQTKFVNTGVGYSGRSGGAAKRIWKSVKGCSSTPEDKNSKRIAHGRA
jgi:hypothetical protein